MSTFLERLIEEKDELIIKQKKLTDFLNDILSVDNFEKVKDFDPVQLELLQIQEKIMESYIRVLVTRIKLIN